MFLTIKNPVKAYVLLDNVVGHAVCYQDNRSISTQIFHLLHLSLVPCSSLGKRELSDARNPLLKLFLARLQKSRHE